MEVYDPEVGKWVYGPSLPVALSNIGKLKLRCPQSGMRKRIYIAHPPILPLAARTTYYDESFEN